MRSDQMVFDGRRNIVEIDNNEKIVYFETWKPKKITGTRIGSILGYSEFSTPFKVACEIAGIYPGDKPDKYIHAGNILEPVLRNYVGHSATKFLFGPLELSGDVRVKIEEPVEKEKCQYDHFHGNKLFGGLVDGYVLVNGKREAVLEIKTSHNKTDWEDGDGGFTNIPMTYMLQASLYAELANLDKIVFVVGFLKDPEDFVHPNLWKPSKENTYIIIKEKLDMSKYMSDAESWYKEYILNGQTPAWTDRDGEVLKYIKATPKQ